MGMRLAFVDMQRDRETEHKRSQNIQITQINTEWLRYPLVGHGNHFRAEQKMVEEKTKTEEDEQKQYFTFTARNKTKLKY